METGREIYVDPQTAAAGYREKFDAHAAELAAMAGGFGMMQVTMRTDEPLESALWEMLSTRERLFHRTRMSRLPIKTARGAT